MFHVLACLVLVGCSEKITGEWAVSSAELGPPGNTASLPDLEGTVAVEGSGTATLVLQSGDLDGDFLVINVEGVSVTDSEDEFSLVMTGFQEVPQNAIFVDLNLQCVASDADASCSGTWESVGLDSQEMSVELSGI